MKPAIRVSLALVLAACGTPEPVPESPMGMTIIGPTPVSRGQAVAERVCGYCHQVVRTRESAIEAGAPSFMEIANQPGRNREYLRQFAGETHPVSTAGPVMFPMPTVLLSPEEREDVVLYILSFQANPASGRLPPRPIEPFE